MREKEGGREEEGKEERHNFHISAILNIIVEFEK